MVKYEIFSRTTGICLRAKEIYSSFDPSQSSMKDMPQKGTKLNTYLTIQINTTLSNLYLLHPLEGSSKESERCSLLIIPFNKHEQPKNLINLKNDHCAS